MALDLRHALTHRLLPDDRTRLRVDCQELPNMLGFVVHGIDIAVLAGTQRRLWIAADRRRQIDSVTPNDGATMPEAGDRRLEADIETLDTVEVRRRELPVGDAAGADSPK